jgi:hypothetical protein
MNDFLSAIMVSVRHISERYFVQVLGTERLIEEFARQQKMT